MINKSRKHGMLILSSSMFISTTGSTLMLIALSVSIFFVNSNLFDASGVYVAQFIPVALLMPIAWFICNKYVQNIALPVLEIISALITIGIGYFLLVKFNVCVYILLVIKGFLDMTTKAIRNVSLKLITREENIAKYNNILMSSNFLGQAVGAVIGFVMINKVSINEVAIIDAFSFVISAILCIYLPSKQKIDRADDKNYISFWKNGLNILKNNDTLFRAMIYVLMTVILMQSFNQVARIFIPLVWLGLPKSGGAISEVIGCSGILIGVILVNFFLSGSKSNNLRLFFRIALFSIVLLIVSHNVIICFIFYLIYMILFEVSFMISFNSLLAQCKLEDTSNIMVIFYGMAFGGMSLVTMVISLITTKFGFIVTIIMLVLVGVILKNIERQYSKSYVIKK